MIKVLADLHLHIGQSLDRKAVKITAARSLTLPNILRVAREVKGLSMIGVVDMHSTGVRNDVRTLLRDGCLTTLAGGGYRAGGLTLIPGIEQELHIGEGNAHMLAYFSTIEHLERYIEQLKPSVKNWQLSSQKASVSVEDWLEAVARGEGIWMPAHAFTPHKGIYGNCCQSLLDILPGLPPALEIGLSADRQMARSLSELEKVTLFSNSDAHSLPKIAREYNRLEITENSFTGLAQLVYDKRGQVIANYGLPPLIGKYHRTYCLVCEKVVEGEPPVLRCPVCGSEKIVAGVLDRLASIADRKCVQTPDSRYIYQVPLRELPGVGPKMYQRLLETFGTEMAVLHEVDPDDLVKAAGEKIALAILGARTGKLVFQAGGGGVYGRVVDILS